jgi:hypothetical protein
LHGGEKYALEARSLAVLRLARPERRRIPRARRAARAEPTVVETEATSAEPSLA